MLIKDVVVASPLGFSKTFNFLSPTLTDTGIVLEGAQQLTWDSTNPERIFSASKTVVRSISLVDDSSVPLDVTSYKTDTSNPIGISAADGFLVIGKATGKVFVIDPITFRTKAEFCVSSNLTICKSHSKHMICGGKDVPFSLWDLEKPDAPLFFAKNVRPDTLDLKVPVWLSDASFVENYEDRLFVTSSKYGDFCVYDVRSGQRRPVSRSAWRVSRKHGKKSVGTGRNPAMLRDLAVTRPVTRCVAYTSAPGVGLRAIAGNAIGDICLLDFRVPHASVASKILDIPRCKVRSIGARAAAPPGHVRAYTPAAGAITGLVCGGAGCANLPHVLPHAAINDQPVVVSTSFDRYLRVYDRDSGELLTKIFVKMPVSTLLIRVSAQFSMKSSNEKVESDDIWESVEPVTEDLPPRKMIKKT